MAFAQAKILKLDREFLTLILLAVLLALEPASRLGSRAAAAAVGRHSLCLPSPLASQGLKCGKGVSEL